MLDRYEVLVYRTMRRPGFTAAVLLGGTALILIVLTPILGRSYFPRTDPGQFIISVKMPSGTRIETSDDYIARVEDQVRKVIAPHDLGMIVSNIGITPDLSAIYTPNASMDTAFVQVSLTQDHSAGSYQYIDHVRRRLASEMPEIETYFQAGGLVDSVINQGLPHRSISRSVPTDQPAAFAKAQDIAAASRPL
jgi:multidrug efflux pump subunit AcrB